VLYNLALWGSDLALRGDGRHGDGSVGADPRNTRHIHMHPCTLLSRRLARGLNARGLQTFRGAVCARLGCGHWRSSKVGTIYTLAGSGITKLEAVPNDPAVIEKLNHNAVVFPAEMGRYYDATMWIEGAIIDTVTLFLSKASQADVERTKAGIAQIRAGALQSIVGVITTLPTNGIADDWRRQRLAVLAVIAPRAATFLPAEDLRQLSEVAKTTAAQMTDPEVKSALTQIATVLTQH
jgi:hypothetical protein